MGNPGLKKQSSVDALAKAPKPTFDTRPIALNFEMDTELKNNVDDAFNYFDRGATGEITAKETRMAVRSLGLDPSNGDIAKILNLIITDESAPVKQEQFYKIISLYMVKNTNTQIS